MFIQMPCRRCSAQQTPTVLMNAANLHSGRALQYQLPSSACTSASPCSQTITGLSGKVLGSNWVSEDNTLKWVHHRSKAEVEEGRQTVEAKVVMDANNWSLLSPVFQPFSVYVVLEPLDQAVYRLGDGQSYANWAKSCTPVGESSRKHLQSISLLLHMKVHFM